MFLKSSLFDIGIVEVKSSVECFFNLSREDYFLCLFSWSGLKLIFHRVAQSLIFFESSLKLFVEVFKFWTAEKRDVSSAWDLVIGFLIIRQCKQERTKTLKLNLETPLLKYLPKLNIALLVPLSSFLNLRNILLYLKAFLIFHFVLVCKSSLHAKLYGTLWKYQGTHLLPRSRH